jgi:hypothetical protein
MNYVRCIKNTGFIYDQNGELFDDTIPDLVIGRVYKVAPPAENDGEMLRIIDESGEDYLYPASYFEPIVRHQRMKHQRVISVHLDDFTKDVLHAEAVAARKSVSALLRTWIDERLDLASDLN